MVRSDLSLVVFSRGYAKRRNDYQNGTEYASVYKLTQMKTNRYVDGRPIDIDQTTPDDTDDTFLREFS